MGLKTVEAPSSTKLDWLKWLIATLLIISGLVANYYYNDQPWPLRLLGWLFLLGLVAAVAGTPADIAVAGIAAVDAGDLKATEQSLSEASSYRDRELSALAKFALASIYRDSQRDSDAIRLYQELIDVNSPEVPKTTAQFELAALYEAKHQPGDAANHDHSENERGDEEQEVGQCLRTRLGSGSGHWNGGCHRCAPIACDLPRGKSENDVDVML